MPWGLHENLAVGSRTGFYPSVFRGEHDSGHAAASPRGRAENGIPKDHGLIFFPGLVGFTVVVT